MYDELVKRLRNRRICIQQLGTLNDYPLLGEAADAIENMSEAYDKLSRHMDDLAALMPRWIPVTKRLPEEYVNVLVFLHSLDWNSIYYSIDHLMEDGQWWKASTSWKHEVTHWMPLPEPPTAEEET